MLKVREYCNKHAVCEIVQFHTVATCDAAHVTTTQFAAQVCYKLQTTGKWFVIQNK